MTNSTARSDSDPQGGGARYVIIKNGALYRPNAAGYTMNVAEAGRYTLAEAILHSHPNGSNGPRDGITYELAPPLNTPDPDTRELTPELLEALEGIIHFADAVAYRDDPLSVSLRQWITRAADLLADPEPGA